MKLIQEEIDLGMLGCCTAEIVFYWHPGQKEIISMDPACSQEGIADSTRLDGFRYLHHGLFLILKQRSKAFGLFKNFGMKCHRFLLQ